MKSRSRLSPVVAILAVAACSEPPNAPARIDGPDAGIPEASYRPRSGEEGYRIPPDAIRTGFITGRNGLPREITYEVYGEVAVWEGDIVLGAASGIPATREELDRMIQQRRQADTPNGVVIDGAGYRWTNGIVPYEIDPALPNTARVTNAIAWIEEATAGIDLVPHNGEADYIRFTTSTGCSSDIGKQGGMQDINLADDCSTGNAAHEIIHALGLYHEHTRCDRDTYVTINTANIEEGKEHNFDKNCDDATDYFDYDEGSIMHYGPFFFSKNELPTIVSKRDRDDEMGQRDALGPTDIETLNFLYGAFNDAPTADIAPLAASYPEGTPVNFDGSGSSDADDAVLTYAWTFGDGTCTGGTPPAACSQQSPSHTYADNGSYPVTLTVSDGYLDDVANATATITNVNPVVSAGSDETVNEGSLYTGSGSFVDPGADEWTATVDYGDGSGTQALTLSGSKTFSLSHTYADNGEYTVTVTVTDDDSGSGSDDLKVTVLNVAPIVEAGSNASVTSGQVFDFSGTFSDPGIYDYPWTWEIDWGFGANTTGSTNSQSAAITASRQVCVAGEYSVKLSVTDKDNGTGSDFLTLTVPYFAVTLDISPGGTPNPINIGRRGQWSIAILSTPTFDATGVDPATVVLGDEVGVETPVAQRNNGTWLAATEDVNKDGLLDLVLKFDVPTLVANGDIDASSTTVVLRAFLNDGCTNIRGEGPVIVQPG